MRGLHWNSCSFGLTFAEIEAGSSSKHDGPHIVIVFLARDDDFIVLVNRLELRAEAH